MAAEARASAARAILPGWLGLLVCLGCAAAGAADPARAGATAAVPAMPAGPAGSAEPAVAAAAGSAATLLPGPTDLERRSRALQRAAAAMVAVQARAVEGARTATTLGHERSGSGVVVSADGLVLTVAYLVLEAEEVELRTDAGRSVPAAVAALDPASGLALLRALAPLGLEPVPLAAPCPAAGAAATADRGTGAAPRGRDGHGNAGAAGEGGPLTVASGGDEPAVTPARLVSCRAFAAGWEYLLDSAYRTAPARRDHGGAGLFDEQGALLGVGSLWLSDVGGGDDDDAAGRPPARGVAGPRTPGNLFVPAHLAGPMLAALGAGRRFEPPLRAWIGLNGVEADGGVRVTRVADDSPAEVAGVAPGDRILRLDGVAVPDLARLWRALWSGGPAERLLVLEVERGGARLQLPVYTVDRSRVLRRPEGL